jgi:SAM-dependent methyltransferase
MYEGMIECRICSHKNELTEILSVREMMMGKGDLFKYFLCSECGCLQITNLPDNLIDYYQDYYTAVQTQNKLSLLKRNLWKIRSFLSNYKIYSLIEGISYNSVLNWKRQADLNFRSKILDVGCGNGDILSQFRDHGFMNLTGIDPNLNENKGNNQIHLFRKTILEIEDKFNFIMFNHSFEHIWEQHDTLEKAADLLEKKGVILLRLPVINTAFYTYRENWVQIDAPRHFYIHSMKSIDRLCRQHGLHIYHKYFDSSDFQFLGSEQYRQGIALNAVNSYLKNQRESIFTKKAVKDYRKQAKQLNREGNGDQVVLFMRRIGEN